METQQHRMNRYASPCAVCGALVPALGGSLRRTGRNWEVRHPACAESGAPSVIQVRTSGWTGIRNRRGTCEDAPCCGCCTF